MLKGQKIKLFRKRLQITLQQLSEMTGVSVSVISRYERGAVAAPSLVAVRKIERSLGVPKGCFFA